MGTHDVGTKLDQLYRRVTVPCARWAAGIPGVTPNRVSIAAFLAGGVATPVLLLTGRPRAAGMAFVLSDLLDYLDGDVARAQGTASAQGDILDGILDRYTDLMCVGAMTLSVSGVLGVSDQDTAGRASQPGPRLGMTVGIAAIIGSLLPSYIQALSVANGRKTVQSIGGRGTRNRIVFAGLLARQPFWALVAIAVLGNAAAVHRASHVLRSAADEPVFEGARS